MISLASYRCLMQEAREEADEEEEGRPLTILQWPVPSPNDISAFHKRQSKMKRSFSVAFMCLLTILVSHDTRYMSLSSPYVSLFVSLCLFLSVCLTVSSLSRSLCLIKRYRE